MRYFEASLIENIALGPHTFVLRMGGCEALSTTLPGQFVMMRGDWGADPLLPRAYSLLAIRAGGVVDVLIRGTGNAALLFERALPGATISVLGPLGSTFPAPAVDRDDWLVAGGVGLAPLLMHAARARKLGRADRVTMFYGGRSAADLVLLDDVRATGVEVVLATEDGSAGHAGYVTGAVEVALERRSSHAGDAAPPTLMACGPDPMLLACARVAHAHGLPGYLSLEGEMACGIGACLVCAVPCKSKPFKYTCKDGPVLSLDDLAGAYAAET